MNTLPTLRTIEPKIIVIGSDIPIIQSILDFDYLCGKKSPSIVGIISGNGKNIRFFWGKKEIIIPVYKSVQNISPSLQTSINLFLNISSGRRVLSSTEVVMDTLPNLICGVIFAEQVPEKHSILLSKLSRKKQVLLIGPASTGMIIPHLVKLGAIGGIEAHQFGHNHLESPGNIAIFSSSSGMTNEIITLVSKRNRIAFALAIGGERFPLLTPQEAFLLAENDPQTEHIIYFGELGGTDEYDIATLLKDRKVTKKVIAYIAGSISEMFDDPPQFGHAKAMAQKGEETATSKRKILMDAGAQVATTYQEFVSYIQELPESSKTQDDLSGILKDMEERKKSLFTTTISGEHEGDVVILGEKLVDLTEQKSFAYIVISMFLGKKIASKELETFVDLALKMLVDHGPHVSGAVNTMVTARAGKDLVSSLAAGILTIGSRFGGAINEAAYNWFNMVQDEKSPDSFVEEHAQNRQYIPGIGHKKYSMDNPDPRVQKILVFSEALDKKEYIHRALAVEKITTSKKGNLILNVDGAMAAILLDLLSEKEGYSPDQLRELIEIEFFNSLFVASRSIGFISHYLDQRRLDEGLFRLSDDDVTTQINNT